MGLEVEFATPKAFMPLLSPARFKGAHGGRGSAKSWFFASQVVEALLSGKSVVCIREVQGTIKDSSKRLIENIIAEKNLGRYFKITDQEITCPFSGGLCLFRGMQDHTAESIKSLEGMDIAWWEEAQTATRRSLEVLLPTIRKEGSELWFSWNPNNPDDPVDILLRADPPSNAIVVQVNWTDNPFFPAVLDEERRRLQQTDPDRYLHVWEGEYRTISDAQILKRHRAGELAIKSDAIWYYGLDFGFANDPAAGLRCTIPMPGVLYVDKEIYEVGVPTERMPSFLGGLPASERWPITADSARPETIDYLRRHGFPRISASMKGAGSIEDGLQYLQGMEIVYHPSCVNLAYELRNYSYKVDKRTEDIAPVPVDKHNHLIDALRYATERLHTKSVFRVEDDGYDDNRRPSDYRSGRDDEESYKVV